MARDMSQASASITPEMADMLQKDCDRLRGQGRINRLDNIAVRSVTVTEAWQESGQDYVTVHFLASLLDYTVDERSGAGRGGQPHRAREVRGVLDLRAARRTQCLEAHRHPAGLARAFRRDREAPVESSAGASLSAFEESAVMTDDATPISRFPVPAPETLAGGHPEGGRGQRRQGGLHAQRLPGLRLQAGALPRLLPLLRRADEGPFGALARRARDDRAGGEPRQRLHLLHRGPRRGAPHPQQEPRARRPDQRQLPRWPTSRRASAPCSTSRSR